MDDQTMQFIEAQEREINDLKNRQGMTNNNLIKSDIENERRDVSIVQEQLNLEQEIERIEHLLRGEVLEEQSSGSVEWVMPKDRNLVILSDYGVQLILNTIRWYLNKNTLLSYYEEEVINQKMEDFATALADAVFMEYEMIFEYPTFEECKQVLINRIDKKVELRKFSHEIMGKEVDATDEKGIKDKLLNEMEHRIENEIEKIKQQLIKNKLKRFELVLREVQDAVHSTYLRAYKGTERRTIREHIHVNETRGQSYAPQQQSKLNPMSWIGMGGKR